MGANDKKAATFHPDEELRTEADFLGAAEWTDFKDGAGNVIRTMTSNQHDIVTSTEYFMQEAGQLRQVGLPKNHLDPIRKLRRSMLADKDKGEVGEYLEADFTNNAVGIADGLADVIVVASGSLMKLFGPKLARKILAEVARANEDKVNGKHGPTVWEGEPFESKVLKPEGWEGPDDRIKGLLIGHGFIDEDGNILGKTERNA